MGEETIIYEKRLIISGHLEWMQAIQMKWFRFLH